MSLSDQVRDLREALAQNATELSEAVGRVEQRISELGEPDPDLTADIEAVRASTTALENLAPEAEAVEGQVGDLEGQVEGGETGGGETGEETPPEEQDPTFEPETPAEEFPDTGVTEDGGGEVPANPGETSPDFEPVPREDENPPL